jgi:hypothetical protein
VHSLVALYLEVIALAIILFFVGLAVLRVLIVATRTIVVSIVSMAIVELSVIAIALVASMIVTILVATMLLAAQFMATHGRKMSRLPLLQLISVLGNLLKNASHFVGQLTLLENGNELERVGGHHLVCIHKLKLMQLGLHKEDLFTLLLCHGYLHCLMEVATDKIADKLYLTLHELVHWHEGRLLGGIKPADQLVAKIGEPGNCLKVIPDEFVEVCLCMVCVGGVLFGDDFCPFSQTYILKTLTHQVKQCWTIVLLSI